MWSLWCNYDTQNIAVKLLMTENLRKRLVLPMTENRRIKIVVNLGKKTRRIVRAFSDFANAIYESKSGLRTALAALEREIQPSEIFENVRLISEHFMQ